MKLKSFLIGLSIVVNVLLGWNALNAGAYKLGFDAGNNACAVNTGNQIINQLNESGELTLQTAEGNIVLVPKLVDEQIESED